MNRPEKIEAAEAASLAALRAAPLDRAMPCPTAPSRAAPYRDAASYHRKLDRLLSRMGNLYLLDDILTAIADGRMQSFVANNTWVITKVECYPRARTLHVVAMVGDLEDRDEIERKLVTFADEMNVGLISAHGRMGWLPHARELGWRVKAKSYLFQKEL